MLPGGDGSLFRLLELAGVFVFAVSGASLAARRSFDVVGMAVLAAATALGGGMLRDVLLGALPPAALRDELYLAVPLVATALVLVGGPLVARLDRPVLVFDAAGLGLFAVTGTTKALAAGLGVLPAALLGTMTAVGGGVLRDVLAREVPSVFRQDTALYAIPAALGSLAVAGLEAADALTPATAIGVAVGVLALRLLAMRFDWRGPRPRT